MRGRWGQVFGVDPKGNKWIQNSTLAIFSLMEDPVYGRVKRPARERETGKNQGQTTDTGSRKQADQGRPVASLDPKRLAGQDQDERHRTA